jgi:hypothetical protein
VIAAPENGWSALRDSLVDDLEGRGPENDQTARAILRSS